jgi:hypothetical protein
MKSTPTRFNKDGEESFSDTERKVVLMAIALELWKTVTIIDQVT